MDSSIESTGTLYFQNTNGEMVRMNAQIEPIDITPLEEEFPKKLGCMQNQEFSFSMTTEIEKSNPLVDFIEQALRDIEFPFLIKQARKHKNKRINKKWLKRYGYILIIDGKMHPLINA